MCWRYLSFRFVSKQVLSAKSSLTDLFLDGNSIPNYTCISREKRKKRTTHLGGSFMLALPIFPVRLQTSIVGRIELNFRVRDGNGWTLDLISTNYLLHCTLKTEQREKRMEVRLRLPAQIVGQALGLLVPISCMHYCTSTFGLSTRSSFWALTP